MTGSGVATERRADGAAARMPENNNESCSKVAYRVLDASQRIVIHQVAGRPDNEEVTDALIENDFRPRPRICATHDNCKWMLVLCCLRAALGGDSAPGHVNSLVRDIQPAVTAAKGKEGDALANTIHENDAEVAAKIKKQAQLGEFASQVRIVEGYYNLDTGKVEWKTE